MPEVFRGREDSLRDALTTWSSDPQSCPAADPLIPFIACGDLQGYDADMSHELSDDDYTPLDPVQPPTDPPYKAAMELLRGNASARRRAARDDDDDGGDGDGDDGKARSARR